MQLLFLNIMSSKVTILLTHIIYDNSPTGGHWWGRGGTTPLNNRGMENPSTFYDHLLYSLFIKIKLVYLFTGFYKNSDH